MVRIPTATERFGHFDPRCFSPAWCPGWGQCPLGMSESEAWHPEKESQHADSPSSYTVSLLSCKQPSRSWLGWSPRVILCHHPSPSQPTAQAAGGHRQSLSYTHPLSHRGEEPWQMLRSHLCSMSIWLFQINLNLGFFSLPSMMQREKKKRKGLPLYCNDQHHQTHYWTRISSHTDTHTETTLVWGFWFVFLKLFHKPEAEILTGRVIGQHRAGNKNEFRKSSTLLTSYLDLPFGLAKRASELPGTWKSSHPIYTSLTGRWTRNLGTSVFSPVRWGK